MSTENTNNSLNQQVSNFKLAALVSMARAGHTPSQIGAAVRYLMSGGHVKSASVGLDALTNAAKWTGALALAGSAAMGAGLGYTGERIFGTSQADVDEAREREKIDRLRRAAIRMRAESQALNMAQEASSGSRRKKRPTLQILSSV